jgi:hypothetical protein
MKVIFGNMNFIEKWLWKRQQAKWRKQYPEEFALHDHVHKLNTQYQKQMDWIASHPKLETEVAVKQKAAVVPDDLLFDDNFNLGRLS